MNCQLLQLLPLISSLLLAIRLCRADELWQRQILGNDVQTKENEGPQTRILQQSRQHKAFFVDYPSIQRVYKDNDLSESSPRKQQQQQQQQRRKHQKPTRKPSSDSEIYFIKLPPAPYSYVEGLGYISQPPVFSPPSLPKRKIKPTAKPFVKLPIDFISNGKPTKVYHDHDDATSYQLNRGPYSFNGKPSGIYVIKKKKRKRKPVLTKAYKKRVVVKQ